MNRTLVTRALLLRNLRNVADTLKQPKRNSGHGCTECNLRFTVHTQEYLLMPTPEADREKIQTGVLIDNLLNIYMYKIPAITWSYRVPPPLPSKRSIYLAEGIGGIAWFWILWHIATEPEHIYGEWPYVPPSTWTDEELGIPPDSEGPLKH